MFRYEYTYTEADETTLRGIESRLAAGLSRVRLANETDIRLEHLEGLLRRQKTIYELWEEDIAPALQRLADWLSEHDATGNDGPAHATTPTFQRIGALLAYAQGEQQLIAITGDVGIGKSRAAQAFAAANPKTERDAGAVYVEFSIADAKPAAALERIHAALPGQRLTSYRQAVLLDAVADRLQPGDLLILDECNYLSGREGRDGRALDLVRDLHGKCGAGVAMLGNPELRARVWGKTQDFAALASRTLHFDLGHTKEPDVDAWLHWAGLMGGETRRAALKIAARPGQHGGLRSLAKVMEMATKLFPGLPPGAALKEAASTVGRA